MSKCNWSSWIIVGLIALNSFLAGTLWAEISQQPFHKTNVSEADNQSNAIVSPWPVSTLAEAQIREPDSARLVMQIDQRELRAQESMAWSAFWMLIVTAVGVFFVAGTLHAALKANQGFQVSAERQLRAYVHGSVEFAEYSDTQIHIYPVWTNSGQTPTRRARYGFNLVFQEEELPDNFQYLDRTAGIGAIQVSAGKSSAATGVLAQRADFERALKRQTKLFVWGWIEYNDVFPRTDRRRTEFAVQFIPAPAGKSAWLNAGRHNGADDECLKKPRTE